MLTLLQIPMRQDNYTYALIKDESAVIIDPSDAEESLAYFNKNPHLKLVAILNTHSHWDHVGGNEVLSQKFGCPVYGPSGEKERVPHISDALIDNDEITLLNTLISAHDVRAHTSGHMAFMVHTDIDRVIKHGHNREPFIASDLAQSKVLFVGDSLFAAGCGRLFEGTPENLFHCLSFYKKQNKKTLMACAHEYTASNLRFALEMMPHNQDIRARKDHIENLLKKEGASVPCFFELELKTNPFLLALADPEKTYLANKFGLNSHDLVSIVAKLRKAKDDF